MCATFEMRSRAGSPYVDSVQLPLNAYSFAGYQLELDQPEKTKRTHSWEFFEHRRLKFASGLRWVCVRLVAASKTS